mmetsp:Transcript_24118/g.35984  ORF Transcript_24118/g.35984 Transcript_24118/m.35984 type:complete len:107 (+) Transcript_24118:214-534(+)
MRTFRIGWVDILVASITCIHQLISLGYIQCCSLCLYHSSFVSIISQSEFLFTSRSNITRKASVTSKESITNFGSFTIEAIETKFASTMNKTSVHERSNRNALCDNH